MKRAENLIEGEKTYSTQVQDGNGKEKKVATTFRDADISAFAGLKSERRVRMRHASLPLDCRC